MNRLGIIEEADKSDDESDDPRGIRVKNPANMTFNEQDIMGIFDKDEQGGIILLTNKKGDLVDKMG